MSGQPKTKSRSRTKSEEAALGDAPETDVGLKRKARIVNAAVELFAERSFTDVHASEIAARAGVSRALMWYHFKTKEEIRQHADRFVLDTLADFAPAGEDESGFETIARSVAERSDYTLLLNYLLRMLMDGGERSKEAGAMLHRRVARFANLAARSRSDRQWEVVMLSAVVGAIVLRPFFQEQFKVDIYAPEELLERARVQAQIVAFARKARTKKRSS